MIWLKFKTGPINGKCLLHPVQVSSKQLEGIATVWTEKIAHNNR